MNKIILWGPQMSLASSKAPFQLWAPDSFCFSLSFAPQLPSIPVMSNVQLCSHGSPTQECSLILPHLILSRTVWFCPAWLIDISLTLLLVFSYRLGQENLHLCWNFLPTDIFKQR